MRTRCYQFSLTAVAALALLLTAGCETGPEARVDMQEPTLNLSTSQDRILVGETTTIFAQTTNLLGREVQIEWGATLGEVTPAREGRVAQFRSDQPGTAIVTAEVRVNGHLLRDDVQITVSGID